MMTMETEAVLTVYFLLLYLGYCVMVVKAAIVKGGDEYNKKGVKRGGRGKLSGECKGRCCFD